MIPGYISHPHLLHSCLAMKDTYGKTSTGMTKFTKNMSKGFNKAGANLSRMGSNLISSNKKKSDVSRILGAIKSL